jgi:hypothetical protein
VNTGLLIKEQLQQIESSEMRLLKSVGGYRKTDKNRSMYNRLEINLFNLRGKVKRIPTELFITHFKSAN